MRRGHSRTLIVGLALSGLLASFWLPARAATYTLHYDEFKDRAFDGSDGSAPWASDWIEIGEGDGARDGAVQVKKDASCADENCLYLGRKDNARNKGAYRAVDLSGASSATLSFLYRRHQHGDGEGRVELSTSTDGGVTWALVRTYRFSGEDAGVRAESVALGGSLSADTRFRFVLKGGDDGDIESHLNVDNVLVVGVWDTTTTTTTTTTVPPTTTTTTTVPPTTTTTVPPTTTTTTYVPWFATTTTTTTTEPPVAATTTTTTTPPPGAATTSTTLAPGETTTTTMPEEAGTPTTTTVAPPVPTEITTTTIATIVPTGSEPPAAGSRPTEGLALSQGAPEPVWDRPASRNPLSRLMADFSTTVEYLSAPAFTFVILAAAVAWLSVKGLERAPTSRRIRLPNLRWPRRR